MEINIKNLIGKMEIHCRSNEPQESVWIEKVSEVLGKAMRDASVSFSQVPNKKLEGTTLDEKIKYHQKKIHDILNQKGEYNTYLLMENVAHPNVKCEILTAKNIVSHKEVLSIVRLFDTIEDLIIKRTKDFKE